MFLHPKDLPVPTISTRKTLMSKRFFVWGSLIVTVGFPWGGCEGCVVHLSLYSEDLAGSWAPCTSHHSQLLRSFHPQVSGDMPGMETQPRHPLCGFQERKTHFRVETAIQAPDCLPLSEPAGEKGRSWTFGCKVGVDNSTVTSSLIPGAQYQCQGQHVSLVCRRGPNSYIFQGNGNLTCQLFELFSNLVICLLLPLLLAPVLP